MAISTQGITFKWGNQASALNQTIAIRNIPNLGGSPNLIDVTTLLDTIQKNILGIQKVDTLEFTALYTKTDFTKVSTDARKPMFYELSFGAEGTFAWQGQHDVYTNSAGVDDPVEMTIVVAASTKPTLKG